MHSFASLLIKAKNIWLNVIKRICLTIGWKEGTKRSVRSSNETNLWCNPTTHYPFVLCLAWRTINSAHKSSHVVSKSHANAGECFFSVFHLRFAPLDFRLHSVAIDSPADDWLQSQEFPEISSKSHKKLSQNDVTKFFFFTLMRVSQLCCKISQSS